MVLLRLSADILLYVALALLAYWFISRDTSLLWLAVGCGMISLTLFIFTDDLRRLQRNRKSGGWDVWDWWFFVELLEIPFRIIIWLSSRLWHIFD